MKLLDASLRRCSDKPIPWSHEVGRSYGNGELVVSKESDFSSGVAALINAAGKAAKDAGGAASSLAADAASGVVSAFDEVGKAASIAGDTISKAAGAAAADAAEAVSGARRSLEKMADDALQADLEKYRPEIIAALKSMDAKEACSFIKLLGDSPLPLTYKNVEKVKSCFPVPREQTVLWADAEFDLRPSGIAVTNSGVYIKSDVDAFTITDKGVRQDKSRLLYFQWEYFEAAWFTSEGDDNPACSVCESCAEKFITVCKNVSNAKLEVSETGTAQSAISVTEDGEVLAEVTAAANVMTAEQAVFVEQHSTAAGHGELAEEANNIIDKLHGHDAKILGRDNVKNGPDRSVDGVYIQTKYYKSARGSLESSFDSASHQYRYMKNGKPMQLEVPKDQYEQVLRGFEDKIRQGKVPGVTDPKEAKNIVREGKITYKQARNLTKAGTIDSLKYDAATGAVMCTCAFGVSFVATAFMSYRKTKDPEASIRAGVAAGVQVFGMTFIQHLVISQLSRTGAADVLAVPSRIVVDKLGTQMSRTIVNGLRALGGKAPIGGAAATKQLAKMLRSNAITAVATFAILSIPDTMKLASGKSSGAQYAQNMASLAASIAGAGLGTLAAGAALAKGAVLAKGAAAAGTAVAPGVGTLVGLAGGFIGGTVGAVAANAVGGILYEGDGVTFSRYFNALLSAMSVEYMMDSKEIDTLVEMLDKVPSDQFSKLMEETFAASEQEAVVRVFLDKHFDAVVSKREKFVTPTIDQVSDALVELEERC